MYVAGLDLGQAADYTALAIVESTATTQRVEFDTTEREYAVPTTAIHEIDGPPVHHYLGWLERYELGTRYPAVVEHVLSRVGELPGGCVLCIDHTGVGRAVVDLFHEAGAEYVAVTITGGNQTSGERNEWRVPKRDLIHGLLVAFQEERFTYSAQLPLVATFVNELTNFQLKVNAATGHDSYESWREGIHDDLVLAVALAVWLAEAEIALRASLTAQALEWDIAREAVGVKIGPSY